MSDQEQERLKQLRERQLQARDPLAKQRKFQQNSAVKEKRMRKKFTLSGAWSEIPHVIKAPFYGLILGTLLTFILPSFWNSPYTILVGIGITLIFMLFGVVFGNALDLRDEIKNNTK
jgi:hypothetical protein